MADKLSMQDIILTLQQFWAKQGCMLMQSYDTEKGAGTMSPYTFLRAIGPEPWNVAYVEPSRRPADGRYGENPNRLYQHHQFQGKIHQWVVPVWVGKFGSMGWRSPNLLISNKSGA